MTYWQDYKKYVKNGISMLRHDVWRNKIIEMANYIIEHKSTVRETAKKFGVSKSKVHRDMTFNLPDLNYNLSLEVFKIIQGNKAERAMRGGEQTRKHWRDKMYRENSVEQMRKYGTN